MGKNTAVNRSLVLQVVVKVLGRDVSKGEGKYLGAHKCPLFSKLMPQDHELHNSSSFFLFLFR